MDNLATPGGGEQDELLQILARDLDPATLEIVRAKLYDAHRLSVIRDAFMEGKDALAVKMIRDLDDMRLMDLLPLCSDFVANPRLRVMTGGYADPEGLLPMQSAQISARPQIPFRGTNLVIERAHAERVMVNAVQIGNESQFVQAGDVPGEIFAVDVPLGELARAAEAELAPDGREVVWAMKLSARERGRLLIPFDMPETQVGMAITITITNMSDQPLPRFGAAMIGATRRY